MEPHTKAELEAEIARSTRAAAPVALVTLINGRPVDARRALAAVAP